MTTKDLILHTALRLFSERGYDGVSMRDLATEVGIKAASIYNHFSSKEDIFNSLLLEMQNRYKQTVNMVNVPSGNSKEAAIQYVGISEKQLQEIAGGLFLYFAKDEFAAPFRKMITTEQYRNSVAGDVFRQMFINDALEYQTELFQTLIEQGEFIDADPGIIALHFYSTIFLLLESYDETQESKVMETLRKHVSQFSRLYVRR
ncbi:TetR/AcrR family transcriptional regulator [Anaerocolumna sp.]|uniref:TetR/AcrR family transcriptional regulator n=1 Tax=Anaerocolumna sp. TaxID=2041569 RepID=UPI0028AA1957|nr:helix-turn-helix domain-containing protein [Anaerocolumna sp.]